MLLIMLIAPYLLWNRTRVVTVFAFVIWGVLPNVAQAGLFGWQSKVEQLEEKLHQVEAEVSSLPLLSVDPTPWTLGYRSDWIHQEDEVVTIDIKFEEESNIDLLVLFPAVSVPESQISKPFGFPKRFLIEGLREEAAPLVLADYRKQDYQPSGIEPQIFKLPEARIVNGIRLTVSRHAENPTWWHTPFITALSEIMVFSGEWNVALGGEVHTSSERTFGTVWNSACLVDGFSLFSPTEGLLRSPLKNYYSPHRRVQFLFALEEVREIDELRIWPVKHSVQHSFPQVNGVEFPTRIHFEKLGANKDESAETLYQSESSIRPGSSPLMLRLPRSQGQRFLLTLSDPFPDFRIQKGPRIALSEIEILSKGQILNRGRQPKVIEGDPDPSKLASLVDGNTSEGRILGQRAWVQALHRRATLERELIVLEQELAFSQRQERERLWWILLLFLICLPLLVWIVRGKVNQRWRRDREQFASDLHDEVGANVSSISHTVELVRETLPDSTPLQRQMLDEAMETATLTSEEIQNFIEVLESKHNDFNLLNQLPEIIERILGKIALDLTIAPDLSLNHLRVPRKWDFLLFVKEALNNIVKHADATQVEMELARHGKKCQLVIADNGKGMPEDWSEPRHLKLRAKRLKGHLEIKSASGQGTRVLLRF